MRIHLTNSQLLLVIRNHILRISALDCACLEDKNQALLTFVSLTFVSLAPQCLAYTVEGKEE